MEELSLSQAFEELEQITGEFEKGEVDLEKGIPKFKRGLVLAKFLKTKLSKIENEIEEIKEKF
ncbi:MAG: exodeoxyribonuclease VII small subunit [bacterium]